MKRLIALLLMLTMLIPFVLSGCSKEEKQEVSVESVADRYYLFISDNKLHCLDAQNGQTKQIETGTDVLNIENAMVSEENSRMLICVATQRREGEDDRTALLLWDGESANATLIDTDAVLARVNRAMDSVVYAKGNDLYQYRSGSGTEKLFEYYKNVSVAEDLSRTLVTVWSAEHIEQTNAGEMPVVSELSLIYKETGKEARTIAQISSSACRPSATSDLSVVCYTKGPSATPLFEPYQAYIWTPEGGEQELPFKTIGMKLQSPNEIYYSAGMEENGVNLYYYDGKTSHLLYSDVTNHGHKLSEQLVCWHTPKGDLLLHGGKFVQIPNRLCIMQGYMGGVSQDGKTVYYSNKDTWYKAQLQDNGEITVKEWFQGADFSVRSHTLAADQVIYREDGVLRCDGKQIADGNFDWGAGITGKLHYAKDGVLYRYENGQSTKVADVAQGGIGISFENNVVLMESDGVYFLKGTEKTLVTKQTLDFVPVYVWGVAPMGNLSVGGAKTGWWYAPQQTMDMLVGD